MTEREKMLAGRNYDPRDPELLELYWEARSGLKQFSEAVACKDRMKLLQAFMPGLADDAWIEPPFSCEYGKHITIGARSYLNVDCFLQDCGRIGIGEDVLIGPGTRLCTASHPLEASERVLPPSHSAQAPYVTSAAPITIENRVWLGASVTVLGGVTIGEGSVVGAGSVVTRDVPAGTVVAGVPAKVIRSTASGDG